jgi:hypothetical protein
VLEIDHLSFILVPWATMINSPSYPLSPIHLHTLLMSFIQNKQESNIYSFEPYSLGVLVVTPKKLIVLTLL